MDRKRPLEGGEGPSTSKKAKTDAVSASSATFRQGDYPHLSLLSHHVSMIPCFQNALSVSGHKLSPQELIQQKRAEIAAKVAAMQGAGVIPATKPALAPKPTPSMSSATLSDDIAKKIAEAKRKVQNAHQKVAMKENPYMKKGARPPPEPPVAPQGVGLKMAAHPLLLDTTPALPQSKKDRYKPMQPKFASIKANTRNVPTPPPAPVPVPIMEAANPYTPKEPVDGMIPKERVGRSFRFNPKGKYVALADQARKDAQLEALKQRIADQARKAGLDSDMGIEKNIKRPPPPEAEWWDAALLPNKHYDDLSMGMETLNIHNADSPITIYIQHPIPIPAPGDKNKVELKPLMLTSKEQKKMRKLRRAGELQDKRDRIRMGLLPPEQPKVRLANLMKVLTSDAIQDPTRVEAKVRREVAMRRHVHEKMNSERKLTDEQRREKVENKKVDEEKKGIHGAVFKIKTLTDPSHQFKVRKNAEQMNLTGVCIFNPAFSMVYVEGAPKYMRQYKRLMTHRMAWTEASRPRGGEDVEFDDESAGDVASTSIVVDTEKPDEPPISLEDNKCWLVWEGDLRERSFSTFKAKSCQTDRAAKELLGEKLKGYWDQSKNWKGEEEELF